MTSPLLWLLARCQVAIWALQEEPNPEPTFQYLRDRIFASIATTFRLPVRWT